MHVINLLSIICCLFFLLPGSVLFENFDNVDDMYDYGK